MTRRSLHLCLLAAAATATLLLASCSARKNTAGSRFWQSLNTRYNVYYHGKTNYDEQIKEMESTYEDDYSQRLYVHPAEARSNPKAPQPKGSFDRTIEKMQKAIALHSIKKKPKKKSGKNNDPKYKEWMARDEYNPFMHNCWFMLAKAQYMKGDFLNASATFRYISRHFTWKTDLVKESQVWEALCYCALGWPGEAENVLAHLHADEIENSRIRALANLAIADYYIKDNQSGEAIPYLVKALRKANGPQKTRLNFLLGQLYQDNGQSELAYEAYRKAGSSSSASYRTKFNSRIRQSAVFHGSYIEGEVRALRRMTRYDRNKEYQDQIYYAIGNLYLTRQDTAHAIENYVKAAEKSTRNGIDKAISQITLGAIYFTQHKYDLAQPCYAEAVPLLNEDYPNYKAIKQRSDVLDELAVYSQNVTLQDSLLRLSKMSDDEVKAVIKKIIDELKKKEKEERENAEREAYLADQAAKGGGQTNKNAPQQFQINNDKSWYFYNNATKNAGKTQFQQLWGSRKLEDHWRRRNKTVFALDESESSDSTRLALTDSIGNDSVPVDREALKRAEDPHYEEYYLKQIPKTEEQIQAAHDVIQEGLYNMGVILKDKLEDYDAAADEFNRLLIEYPDNTYRLDVYYNMYLMYMRQNNVAKANNYRDLILSDFAESKEGQAIKDPNYIENLKNMLTDQELMYERAYADYLNNNNASVHAAYQQMMEKYPLSKVMPKFMFIDALSYVSERNYDKFKETIKDLLKRYPETDITPVASGMVKNINAGRKLEGGGSNVRGMLWSTRLSNDTTPENLEKKFTPFAEDNEKPQVFILLYPTDSVSSNWLLFEVARHNFNTFVTKDYDLEQMNFGRLGLLVVKGFQNFKEVTHYRTVFEQDTSLVMPPQVHPVLISESNFQLLLNEGRSFEDYFEYLEHKDDEKFDKQIGKDVDSDADSEDQKDEESKDDGIKKDQPKKDEPKKDEPKKDEPKKDEPKKDEPKKDEPKKDEPKKDEPKMDEPKKDEPKKDEPKKDEPKKDEPKKDEPKKDEPKKDEPKKDEPKKDEPIKDEPIKDEPIKDEPKMDEPIKDEPIKDQPKMDEPIKDEPIKDEPKMDEPIKDKPKPISGSDADIKKDADNGGDVKPMAKPDDKPADKPADKQADDKDKPQVKKDKEEQLKKEKEEQLRKEKEKEEQEEIKRSAKRKRKQEEAERKRVIEDEKKRQKEEEKREREQIKNLQKSEKQRARDEEKEELKRLKEQDKEAYKRAKEQEKENKKLAKEREKEEKARLKELERQQKQYNDSVARAQRLLQEELEEKRMNKYDSLENLQIQKRELAKQAEKDRKEAKKLREKERKERIKQKEQQRKLKEKERKERQKEREKARKQREKERKEAAKDRQREREQTKKDRDQQRQQRGKTDSTKTANGAAQPKNTPAKTDDGAKADGQPKTDSGNAKDDSNSTNAAPSGTRSVRDRKNNN